MCQIGENVGSARVGDPPAPGFVTGWSDSPPFWLPPRDRLSPGPTRCDQERIIITGGVPGNDHNAPPRDRCDHRTAFQKLHRRRRPGGGPPLGRGRRDRGAGSGVAADEFGSVNRQGSRLADVRTGGTAGRVRSADLPARSRPSPRGDRYRGRAVHRNRPVSLGRNTNRHRRCHRYQQKGPGPRRA
jgi:hypothetical protein